MMMELTNDMSFEQAYTALKETVAAMGDPQTTVEDSLVLYERACRLVIYCQRKLNDLKLEVTEINERMAELKNSHEDLF